MNFIKENLRYIIVGAVVLAICVSTVFFIGHSFRDNKENTCDTDSAMMVKDLVFEYGICVNDYDILHEHIKPNQNIADLLRKYNVPYSKINEFIVNSRDIIDVRKIRSGNPFCVFQTKDTVPEVHYFVYEETPVDFVVIDFCDSLRIFRDHKEVTSVKRSFKTEIKGSLWDVIVKNGQNPNLAISLSEVYAWTIDFFRIQAGDSIKVIFQEDYVDSTSIGIGKIYAAYFYHNGEGYYAIPFEQDGTVDFFDEKGNSLRRAFLKAPLKFSRISSNFSYKRFHPVLKVYRPHTGVDYAAPSGTPVHTIGDGTVTGVAYTKGGGRTITIRHNSVYTTKYLHLSRYAKKIRTGVRVRQGDVIGYVGSSGMSTGPHLDFRLYQNGKPINPIKFKSPPVEPVKKKYMEEFNRMKDSILIDLNKI